MWHLIKRYRHKIRGWDNGAVFFTPDRGYETGNASDDAMLQNHPELMEKIIELCEGYFNEIGWEKGDD